MSKHAFGDDIDLGSCHNKVWQRALVDRSSSHCVSRLGYHLVWCTKYRHPVLVGRVEGFVRRFLVQVCQANDWGLLALEVMPDHVHLFVQLEPSDSIPDVVRLFKSTSAVAVFAAFPELKGQRFWGSGLWSRGYYVGTVGDVGTDTVRGYVESQHKRPYKVSHR